MSSIPSRLTGDAPSLWQEWRRPIITVATLLLTVALGLLWLRRDARRIVLVPNGVMLLAADTGSTFFPESSFVLQPAGGDAGAYPIVISAWYDSKAAIVSEAEIVRFIAWLAGSGDGVRLRRVRGGVLHPDLASEDSVPWVSISMDFGAMGNFRSDVLLHCRVRMGDGSSGVLSQSVATTRGVVDESGTAKALANALNAAWGARCPGDRATPQVARVALASPSRVSEQDTTTRRARGDSIALDRASALSQEVARLVVAVDTLHLRVGEVVNPQQALRLTAVRADGSVMLRVVPIYSIVDMSVAAMGAGGVRGVAVGVTRAIVRPMTREAMRSGREGVSASFVIKVTP